MCGNVGARLHLGDSKVGAAASSHRENRCLPWLVDVSVPGHAMQLRGAGFRPGASTAHMNRQCARRGARLHGISAGVRSRACASP